MLGLSIPYLQIRSNTLYQYNQTDMAGKFCRTIQSLLANNIAWKYDHEGTLIKHSYTGKITPGAKKRLTKAIENLVQITPVKQVPNFTNGDLMPFSLSFITLTITDLLPVSKTIIEGVDENGQPYKIENETIDGKAAYKNLLSPFLKWMRDTKGVQSYIWKAEIQKRGVLHYHITSDARIHWQDVRKKWNALQERAGYTKAYFKRTGHHDPNSVDIHAVDKIQNMAGYLIKEIAKSYQNGDTIGSKVWDCSLNLKMAKYYTTLADSQYEAKINYCIKKNYMVQVPCKSDHCRIFRMLIDKPASWLLNPTDIREYRKYIETIRSKELENIRTFKPTRKKQVTDFNPETYYNNTPCVPVQLITKKAIQLTFNRGEVDIGFRVETALYCSN